MCFVMQLKFLKNKCVLFANKKESWLKESYLFWTSEYEMYRNGSEK